MGRNIVLRPSNEQRIKHQFLPVRQSVLRAAQQLGHCTLFCYGGWSQLMQVILATYFFVLCGITDYLEA